jgi:hypothetical protein
MGRLEGKREGLCGKHDLRFALVEAVSQDDRDESSAHVLSKEYDDVCAMGARVKKLLRPQRDTYDVCVRLDTHALDKIENGEYCTSWPLRNLSSYE